MGYPTLIWFLAHTKRISANREAGKAANDKKQKSATQLPDTPISIVIVAYNEALALPRKISSILNSDCSTRIGEVLVASDGSTDDTRAVVEAYSDPRIRLLDFPKRRGKPSVLNDAIPECSSDFVVLTDARQELHASALSELVSNFADP